MIKCLECGFETHRLQWTHFKFNCTGKFSNGKEYRKAYPNAKLVSDELAKETAVTLANFIKKYGEIEGNDRWGKYRGKQAYSNSYEYKKEKLGWTKEQYDSYNQSRSQTLEKMVKRHGEEEGVRRWQVYCNRQAFTNTKAYFINKYGIEKGTAKYLDVNKRKAVGNPVYLAEKLSITVDQATDIILSRYKNRYTSNLEKEFVSLLEEQIGTLDHTSNRNPFGKWSHYLNTYVVYDIKHNDFIIEFNGDYWHANPKIYKDDTYIRGTMAIDIQQRDMLKLKTVKDLGFRVLTVWESDFKSNKIGTIKDVIQWIQSEQK